MSITTGLIVAFAPKPASENFLSIIWAMTMIIFATLSILLGGIMQLLPHDGSDGALLLYALIQ